MTIYESGVALGSTLGEVAGARTLVRHRAQALADFKRARVDARVVGQTQRVTTEARRLMECEETEAKAVAYRDSIDGRRRLFGADFDLVRALLFLTISLLFVVADLSVLSVALARFLGYASIDPRGRSITTVLFTEPLTAFREFPDVLLLTVAVLLMGFTIKVWRDTQLSEPTPGTPAAAFRKHELWIAHIALGLSLLCILATAIARFEAGVVPQNAPAAAPPPITQGAPSPIVNADAALLAPAVLGLLGFAIPLLSAVFFMRGYDAAYACWSRRQARRAARTKEKEREAQADKVRRCEERLLNLRLSQQQRHGTNYSATMVHARLEEFDAGYRDGLSRLYDRAEQLGLYRTFRGVALRSALTP